MHAFQRLLAVGAVMTGIAAAVVGPAPAAEAAAPSILVCAQLKSGGPYVGPMTAVTRNFWDFAAKQSRQSGQNGCAILGGLVPSTSYQVVVDYNWGGCNGFGGSGQSRGNTKWVTTPRSGQINLGTFTVTRTWYAC